MSVVDALGSSASSSGSASATGYSAMSAQDFTKLIFAELARQDPTNPTDTNALLQQISMIRNIQSDVDLSANLKTLVNQNELASASNMIGLSISGVSVANERVTDTVKSVSRTSDGTVLNLLGGGRVRMSNVDTINIAGAS
jgi:flagellar basal-body rod modification protein FlgD